MSLSGAITRTDSMNAVKPMTLDSFLAGRPSAPSLENGIRAISVSSPDNAVELPKKSNTWTRRSVAAELQSTRNSLMYRRSTTGASACSRRSTTMTRTSKFGSTESAVVEKSSHNVQSLHKTKLCQRFARGKCSAEKECTFAHGVQELRTKPDFSKTRLCEHFVAFGFCANEKTCIYAHKEEDLRFIPESERICYRWRLRQCEDANCPFAHGIGELSRGKTGLTSPSASDNDQPTTASRDNTMPALPRTSSGFSECTRKSMPIVSAVRRMGTPSTSASSSPRGGCMLDRPNMMKEQGLSPSASPQVIDKLTASMTRLLNGNSHDNMPSGTEEEATACSTPQCPPYPAANETQGAAAGENWQRAAACENRDFLGSVSVQSLLLAQQVSAARNNTASLLSFPMSENGCGFSGSKQHNFSLPQQCAGVDPLLLDLVQVLLSQSPATTTEPRIPLVGAPVASNETSPFSSGNSASSGNFFFNHMLVSPDLF